MKIGEVSNILEIPISTIRHYIDLGLILPLRNRYHYNFSEQEIDELRLIIKYKKLNFTLEEIHNIVSLYRVSYVTNSREVNQMLGFLTSKRDNLIKQRDNIANSIRQLDDTIQSIITRTTPSKKITGFPVTMLSFLKCPLCNHDFVLNNATIKESKVITGELVCNCCSLLISSGILYSHTIPDISKSSLFNMSNTLLEEYNAKTINNIKKDEMDLLKNIKSEIKSNQLVIMETNIKRWFFLLKNIESLDNNNFYIITEQYPEVIQYYKSQMDLINNNYNILFMVSKAGLYPIKDNIIDIWIDYMDSVEHSETEKSFLPYVLMPYFKSGTTIHGITMGLRNKWYIESLRVLHPGLPDNILDYFGEGAFIKQLEAIGYKKIKAEKLRDVWETSKQSGIHITQFPPYRIIYSAKLNK